MHKYAVHELRLLYIIVRPHCTTM